MGVGGVSSALLLLPSGVSAAELITQCREVVRVNDREPLIEHLLRAGPCGETEMNEMEPPMTTQRVSLTEHD